MSIEKTAGATRAAALRQQPGPKAERRAAGPAGPSYQSPRVLSEAQVAFPPRPAAAPIRLEPPQKSSGWSFDWDDNIFNMPTRIRLRHKETGEEVLVSSAEWAIVREGVGKHGKYADYQTFEGSLLRFGSDPEGKRNFFLEDVQAAVRAHPTAWQGPSWKAFVRALENPETARRTSIITARHVSPDDMFAALEWLKGEGYLQHLPAKENVFPVSYPPLKEKLGNGNMQSPSEAKAIVMRGLLDELDASPVPETARPIRTPDGRATRPMHIWGFSDDDWGNFEKARQALCEGMAAGRWTRVKILIFFTGKNHPTERPRAEVLTPEGKTRAPRADEAVLMRG